MARQSGFTTDPEFVMKWAVARRAKPARVKGTGNDEDPGMIRLDFPGFSEEGLEEISWEDFANVFEQRNLGMVYEEKTSGGKKSNFHKFIDRSSIGGKYG